MYKWLSKKRNQKGFTLIELIVVIAILGVLAAIAIPRFSGTLGSSKLKADLATEKVIQSAVSVYVAEKGAPASDGTDLFTALTTGDAYLKASELKWASGTAITKILVDKNGSVSSIDPAKPASY